MRRLGLAAVILLTAACSQYMKESGLTADARKTVDVPMTIPVSVAQQAVVNAAVAGGWVVTNNAPGVVTIGPYQFDPVRKVTLRANIIGSDSASHVVVSGTYLDSILGGGEQPIAESIHGRTAQMWNELQRFVKAITPK